MSDTPRTDAEAFNHSCELGSGWVVMADFARQLELEIAELKAKLPHDFSEDEMGYCHICGDDIAAPLHDAPSDIYGESRD